MIASLWTPFLLVGLFAMVWVTTLLERLIASPIVPRPDSLVMAVAGAAPSWGSVQLLKEGVKPCTSEWERSS